MPHHHRVPLTNSAFFGKKDHRPWRSNSLEAVLTASSHRKNLNNVSIQNDCHIGAINKIIIGDNVLIASRVYISDHSHGEITSEALLLPPIERKLVTKGSVIIGDNVWLGEGVVILPGVTIGKNSIIGSNAVVTKSLPENCVAAGNPAIVIKQLNTQMEVANF